MQDIISSLKIAKQTEKHQPQANISPPRTPKKPLFAPAQLCLHEMTAYHFQTVTFFSPGLSKVKIHSVANCKHVPMEAEIPLQAQPPVPLNFHHPPQRNVSMCCVLKAPSPLYNPDYPLRNRSNKTTLNSVCPKYKPVLFLYYFC